MLRSLKEQALREDGVHEAEFCLKVGQGVKVYSVQATALKNKEGQPIGTTSVSCDMTDRAVWREHLLLLLFEVNHRARNLLSVVSAICSLSGKSGSAHAFQSDLKGRVECLACSFELITQDNWCCSSLHKLVSRQLRRFPEATMPRMTFSGPDVFLRPKAMQTIGMVIHELATNACKFGALSSSKGAIEFAWRYQNSATREELELTWRETSETGVADSVSKGFGMLFLERIAASELEGRSEFHHTPAGVTFKLSVPGAHFVRPELANETNAKFVSLPFVKDTKLRETLNRLLADHVPAPLPRRRG